MIQINVSTSNIRRTLIKDENTTTPMDVFNELDINPSVGLNSLDGATITGDKLNKTFAELGVNNNQCFLRSIVKADSARA